MRHTAGERRKWRAQRDGCLRVWSTNSQGLPQYRELLGLVQQSPALRRSCAAVLQQELQRDAEGTDLFREESLRRGVRVTGEPGVLTAEGGVSAGGSIAILAGGPVSTAPPLVEAVERPLAAVGRVTAAAIAFGRGRFLLLLSVYLHTGEPPQSLANTRLLDYLAEVVRAWGGPFLVGGD